MNRRGFLASCSATLAGLVGVATRSSTSIAMPSTARSTSGRSSSTTSLEETRRRQLVEIRTDPDVALDTAIFVDEWRRELGRIINLGSG